MDPWIQGGGLVIQGVFSGRCEGLSVARVTEMHLGGGVCRRGPCHKSPSVLFPTSLQPDLRGKVGPREGRRSVFKLRDALGVGARRDHCLYLMSGFAGHRMSEEGLGCLSPDTYAYPTRMLVTDTLSTCSLVYSCF